MVERATLVIVYDSRTIRETVSVLDLGDAYHVVEVDEPDHVAMALEEHSPDLVLLCAMTRNTSAYDNCRQIKEVQEGVFLPVVLFALRVDAATREKALEVGADAVLPVTTSAEELRFVVQTQIRHREAFLSTQKRSANAARASLEAADMILQLEEADRRIREQNEELERMVREMEIRDRHISAQQAEIQGHLDRLHKEMELAAALQVQLLPDAAPPLPQISLAGKYVPAAHLGGDYYDYFRTPQGRLFICMADVTGHGVAPALVSVQMRTLVRNAAVGGLTPAAVLDEANRFILDTFRGEFLMTMVCLSLAEDASDGVISGAGHCPMIVRDCAKKTTCEIPSTGMPLGVSKAARFEDAPLALVAGMRMLLYTDGITEMAADPQGADQFGPERLQSALEEADELEADAALEALIRASKTFAQDAAFDDDVSLLLCSIHG